MRGEIPVQKASLIAGADLSTKRYYAVKLDANGEIVLAGAGDNSVGILQNTPVLDEVGSVMILGQSYAVAGGIIAAGANVTPNAAGKVVTAGGGDAILGVAMNASAADGEIITILLVTRTSSGVTGIGESYSQVCIPVTLSLCDNGQILSDFVPGYAGTIEKIEFVTGTPTTDAANCNCVINATIETVATTGGVLTLDVDVAGTDPDTLGKIIAATAITGANTFDANDKIDLVVANTGDPFTVGTGTVIMTLKH
jgi:hypothetical protein